MPPETKSINRLKIEIQFGPIQCKYTVDAYAEGQSAPFRRNGSGPEESRVVLHEVLAKIDAHYGVSESIELCIRDNNLIEVDASCA